MQKLFMMILGATPKGRYIEQHDIFFGIADSVKELIPDIFAHWPEANGKVHIDAWREVTCTDGFDIHVVLKNEEQTNDIHQNKKLFFLNLGGYKPDEFEEYHYKMIVACDSKADAIKQARQTAFYKHTGFKGATSHIDDKYGVDVDDIYEITDILPRYLKEKYAITLTASNVTKEDNLNIGYYKLSKL